MSQPDPKKMFRKAALERMSTPERLDEMMRITGRRGWLALGGLIAVLLVALGWGIFGSMPSTVSGQGLIIREGGAFAIPALAAGQVATVNVAVGERVEQGQVVATVQPLTGGPPVEVRAQQTGQVLELGVDVGNVVDPTVAVATIEQVDQPLLGVLYLPSPIGQQVRPGMEVEVGPVSVSKQDHGFIEGTVSWVAPFPSSPQAMSRLLANDALVQAFFSAAGGSPLEVHVALAADPETPSGFEWSSGDGPDTEIPTGTLISNEIIIDDQRPIELVLPNFG